MLYMDMGTCMCVMRCACMNMYICMHMRSHCERISVTDCSDNKSQYYTTFNFLIKKKKTNFFLIPSKKFDHVETANISRRNSIFAIVREHFSRHIHIVIKICMHPFSSL
ncbi:hypothetical protein PUN28_014689 [Cardiocondyla obscurior]|uniref:Uncharacterized protein n=1 Tax=Cardiocondyla obscurior TaxID=286306 RepID=A0AAW2EYF8_9HYME